MTDLIARMIEDMQLHGLSERTQEAYARTVRQLHHYHKSPAQISEEELRDYFLHNENIRKWSRAASSISICGINFFYTYTLKKDWPSIKLVRPVQEKSPPPILSLGEVRSILAQVKMPYHRVCLSTIYSLGLRLGEGTHLQENGVNIRIVQDLMGHADVKTTEIYTHVMEKDISMVLSPLDQLTRKNNNKKQWGTPDGVQ